MIHYLNVPQSIAGRRLRGDSFARLVCTRCGIDLPKTRFNKNGTVHVPPRGRVKDPYKCGDCQIEV